MIAHEWLFAACMLLHGGPHAGHGSVSKAQSLYGIQSQCWPPRSPTTKFSLILGDPAASKRRVLCSMFCPTPAHTGCIPWLRSMLSCLLTRHRLALSPAKLFRLWFCIIARQSAQAVSMVACLPETGLAFC